MIGKKFGKLTVLDYSHKDKRYRKYYKCKCDCNGPNSIKIICGHHLRGKKIKSCGCLRVDVLRKRNKNFDFKGKKNPNWKGGRLITKHGYVLIYMPDHIKSNYHGYIREHILVAQNVLGKLLPDNSVIHHVNENRQDNWNGNLVICQDDNYHKLIHQRKRAFDNCGNANWRICNFCKKYDDPDNLYINGTGAYHHNCRNKYERDRRKQRNKEKIIIKRRKYV